MRHGKKINHLSRKTAHRSAMLSNMACSLIEHKRINTTLAKAKALRKYVEPLITKSKEVLELPDDYFVGIVPGSDTGAIELAMWSLLGERPVEVCGWETFGLTWVKDITKQLKLY